MLVLLLLVLIIVPAFLSKKNSDFDHKNLKVGDVVRLAPGCDQSHKTCHEKFNNHLRYGGHPNMPTENPLETQIIK